MNTKPNRDITAEILKEYYKKFPYVLKPGLAGSFLGIQDEVAKFLEQALTKQKEEIVKYVRDEVIGENEWEDPDIEGSDQSNGDMVVKPWRRNGLRAEQRRKLNELK